MNDKILNIEEINSIIHKVFWHFTKASTNFSKAQEVQKKSSGNLPQAASYGFITFAITLIILQIIYLTIESLFNISVGDFTFLGNLIPIIAGLIVYQYYSKKNKNEAKVYQDITDIENAKGKKLILKNISNLQSLSVDYWTPTATQFLMNQMAADPNLSIEEAILRFNQMINNADQVLIKKYNQEIHQLNFILRDDEVAELLDVEV